MVISQTIKPKEVSSVFLMLLVINTILPWKITKTCKNIISKNLFIIYFYYMSYVSEYKGCKDFFFCIHKQSSLISIPGTDLYHFEYICGVCVCVFYELFHRYNAPTV